MMEIMASASKAESLVKVARIFYQLCDYRNFRAVFLKTIKCRKWLVFTNQVTYIHCDYTTILLLFSSPDVHACYVMKHSLVGGHITHQRRAYHVT